jgi:hypothetical protein
MAHHEHAGKRGAAKSAAGYDRAGSDRSIIIVVVEKKVRTGVL